MVGLLGQIYQYQPDAVTGGLDVKPGTIGASPVPPLSRRIDNAFDWRDVIGASDPTGLDSLNKAPFTARWHGTFIAPKSGTYVFGTFSNGDSGVWIDKQTAVLNVGEPARPAQLVSGNGIELSASQ